MFPQLPVEAEVKGQQAVETGQPLPDGEPLRVSQYPEDALAAAAVVVFVAVAAA